MNIGNVCYAAAAIQVLEHSCAVLGRDRPEVDIDNFKNEQSDACETLRYLLNLFSVECEVVVKSSVTCRKCKITSDNATVETILPLPIDNSLQEAMYKFESVEVLKGSNALECDKCGRQPATKQTTVKRTSDLVFFSLK